MKLRGAVAYWNFLPPGELDSLLKLYGKVAHKTLRISKTFGIEGRKLLTPEDEFEALKNFNHSYEGTTTSVEDMHLEYQKLLQDYPGLKELLDNLPGRVFSGKEHPLPQGRGIFFCYALPAPDNSAGENKPTNGQASDLWTEEAGYTQWYLYDAANDQILEEPSEILDLIRSKPDTDRNTDLPKVSLTEIRKKVEKHIKNTYLKSVVAPVGVKANLKAWMELT